LACLAQLTGAFRNKNLGFLYVRFYAVDHLSLLIHHLAKVLEDLVHVPNIALKLFELAEHGKFKIWSRKDIKIKASIAKMGILQVA
jgi:hypothetical protein